MDNAYFAFTFKHESFKYQILGSHFLPMKILWTFLLFSVLESL